MDLDYFTYNIPSHLIAQEPVQPKDHSRLMVLDRTGLSIKHRHFYDLPDILDANDVLVINNTKVVPVRIMAKKSTGRLIEILLIKQDSNNLSHWMALAKPLKKIKPGHEFTLVNDNDSWLIKVVDTFEYLDGYKRIIVDIGEAKLLYSRLNSFGYAPLPPYIAQDINTRRLSDITNYQTIFAKNIGAIAAPTAGMHFTGRLTDQLRQKNIDILEITLHVGVGTFKPITASKIENHVMESEEYTISKSTAAALNQAKADKKRIIAVGTTTTRALESACVNGSIEASSNATTQLYIKPDYKFKFIDGLITNFHLSKSSLLVMVSTFAGHELTKQAYESAIENNYRFYSYGDAMLIL